MEFGSVTLKMNFDSSSDWVSVQTTNCASCTGDKYDPSSGKIIHSGYANVTFAGGSLDGIVIQDEVCIDKECVNSQEFIGYKEISFGDLGEYYTKTQGLFGFGPESQQSFIKNLKDAGKVAEN